MVSLGKFSLSFGIINRLCQTTTTNYVFGWSATQCRIAFIWFVLHNHLNLITSINRQKIHVNHDRYDLTELRLKRNVLRLLRDAIQYKFTNILIQHEQKLYEMPVFYVCKRQNLPDVFENNLILLVKSHVLLVCSFDGVIKRFIARMTLRPRKLGGQTKFNAKLWESKCVYMHSRIRETIDNLGGIPLPFAWFYSQFYRML